MEGLRGQRARHGVRGHRRRLRDAPPAGRPAAQSRRCRRADARARVQHVGQLRDQHELAELLGRDRREPPHPGRHARRSQLHVRRDGPGHRDRAVPRPHAAKLEDDRQLLGRPDPGRPVHPAADLRRRRAGPRLAGRPADVERPADHHDARGRKADHRLWPDGVAGMDQGAGQQRRRLPERQLRPSVREPDTAHELARDVRDPGDALLADLRLRPLRREPAPGLDHRRRDGADPRYRRGRRDEPRVRRQSAVPGRGRAERLREHGGQGDALRAAAGGLFMAVTTGTSTGAINSWHDSAQPIAGLVPLFNMELGEITRAASGRACTACS